MAACAQSEFSGGSGQTPRRSKTAGCPPLSPSSGGSGDGSLKSEDGGPDIMITKDLLIISNPDGAESQNCVSAKVSNVSSDVIQLGCNRAAPSGARPTR